MKRAKFIVIPFLVAILAVGLTSQASGHALPVRSDPAPNASLSQSPSQVTIWFSETLNPGSPPGTSSHLRVLDSNGNQLDNKNTQFSTDGYSMSVGIPSLPKGVYAVAWQSVSATDGHLASGSFPFGVGVVVPPPPSTQPGLQPSLVSLFPEGIARWSFYAGAFVLFGAASFFLLVLEPLFFRRRIQTPSGRNSAPSLSANSTSSNLQSRPISVELARRVLVVGMSGAAIAILGLSGLLVDQASSGGGLGSLQGFLFGTELGVLDFTRLVLVGASTLILLLSFRTGKPRVFLACLLFAGLLVLFLTSLAGHNAAVGGTLALTGVSVFADWAHLIGVTIWIGGLVHFTSIIPVLRREGQLNNGLLRLVPRFSRISILAVGIIVMSGLYATLYQVGSFAALLDTEYGQTLVIKMAFTGVLVFVGGTNQLLWYPRLTRALRALGSVSPLPGLLTRRLSRFVRLQVVLAFFLILVVGLLTALPTAIQVNQTQNRPALQATTFSQSTGGINIKLSIYPFHVGANSFLIAASDLSGNTLSAIHEVRLDFQYKDAAAFPEQENATRPDANGQWVIQGQDLNRAGNWDITATVERTNIPDAIAYFTINLPQYPGIDSAKVWQIPYPDTNFNGWATLVDGQGNVWFSVPTAATTTPSIGRFSPGTNSFQMYPAPNTSPGPMAFDSDGKIWYENQLPFGSGSSVYGSIGSLDPASGTFSPVIQFPYSNGNWRGGGLTVDSHNIVWVTDSALSRLLAFNQTSSNWIGLNQTSGAQFLNTPQPSADLNAVTLDSSGNVWFVGDALPLPNAQQSGHGGGVGIGKIEMYNQTSRVIKNYVPLSPNSTLIEDVVLAPDGDVWFAAHASNSLGKISRPYSNSTIKIMPLNSVNPGAFPWGLRFDPQGNLWFSEHVANAIGFYNLGTGQFQEFSIPISQSNPAADAKFIALDQYGNVWFAEGQGGNLGVLALLPQAIGLGGQGPDFYYELTVVFLIAFVAIATFRWQKIVRFFSRRRTQVITTTKAVARDQQKSKQTH